MRPFPVAALLAALLAVAAAAAAQESDSAAAPHEEGGAGATAGVDPGLVTMVVTLGAIPLGAAAMWWVNHRYHPPGEAVRARSRKD